MPVLELSVDARGVTQGLTQAERALDQTSRKAKDTKVAVKRMGTTADAAGNNLSAAFAATGGGLSVTRGLVSIGEGFKSANASMATFAASQVLLDLGRFSADMGAVAGATGAAGGAFAKIGAIIKANPLLTIATVLAGAATAMGLFGKETAKTATEWDKLGKSVKDAQLSTQVRSFLGLSQDRGGELSSISALLAEYLKGPAYRTTTAGDLVRQTGLGQSEIQYAARRGGANSSAIDFADGGATRITNIAAASILRQIYRDISAQVEASARPVGDSRTPFFGGITGTNFSPIDRSFYPGYSLPQYAENRRIDQYQLEQRQRGALQFGQGELGPNQFSVNFGGPSTAGDLIRQTPEQRAGIDSSIGARVMEEQRQAAEQAQAAMDQLVQSGREFGATIGDAFFNVASGTQDARQAMAALLADLARAASRQAFANIFGAASGSFGATQAQRTQNVTPGPTIP